MKNTRIYKLGKKCIQKLIGISLIKFENKKIEYKFEEISKIRQKFKAKKK